MIRIDARLRELTLESLVRAERSGIELLCRRNAGDCASKVAEVLPAHCCTDRNSDFGQCEVKILNPHVYGPGSVEGSCVNRLIHRNHPLGRGQAKVNAQPDAYREEQC